MIKNFIVEKEGFSLIELIVVVTIIAVITAIGTVSFSGANKKARDGKRLADLERVRMALEVARQVGTTYPATSGASAALVSAGYLPQYPTGPSGDLYPYERQTEYTYYLYSWLEVGTTTGSYPAVSCGTDKTCNYRVGQP